MAKGGQIGKVVNAAFAAMAVSERYGIPLADLVGMFGDIPAVECRTCRYFDASFRECENEDGLWRCALPGDFCSLWQEQDGEAEEAEIG